MIILRPASRKAASLGSSTSGGVMKSIADSGWSFWRRDGIRKSSGETPDASVDVPPTGINTRDLLQLGHLDPFDVAVCLIDGAGAQDGDFARQAAVGRGIRSVGRGRRRHPCPPWTPQLGGKRAFILVAVRPLLPSGVVRSGVPESEPYRLNWLVAVDANG